MECGFDRNCMEFPKPFRPSLNRPSQPPIAAMLKAQLLMHESWHYTLTFARFGICCVRKRNESPNDGICSNSLFTFFEVKYFFEERRKTIMNTNEKISTKVCRKCA